MTNPIYRLNVSHFGFLHDKEIEIKHRLFLVIAMCTLAGTDLLCVLNWGTQWTMVSYLKK